MFTLTGALQVCFRFCSSSSDFDWNFLKVFIESTFCFFCCVSSLTLSARSCFLVVSLVIYLGGLIRE